MWKLSTLHSVYSKYFRNEIISKQRHKRSILCPTLKTDFAIQENKLVVQIHEKDHDDRDPDYKRRRQKELEKLGYYIVRINPDKPNFDEYEKFGRVQKYIKNST